MTKVILHVEDDEDDVFLFRRAMDKVAPGSLIRPVSDGQMAIDYLAGSGRFQDRQAFPWPCLVLLDLKLPHVPGLEVLNWIRSKAGLILPVVILSSSLHHDDIAAAYKQGANAYLIKPSDPDKFLEMVRMIRGFWVMQNTPPPDSQIVAPVA